MIWRAELRRIRNKFVVEDAVLVVIDTGNLTTVESLEDGRNAVEDATAGPVHRLWLMAAQKGFLVQLLLTESVIRKREKETENISHNMSEMKRTDSPP